MRDLLIGLLAAVTMGACTDTASPEPGLEFAGLDFGIPSGSFGAHTAEGQPATSGPLLDGDFAVTMPDSVGGLVLVSFDRQTAGLFILQIVASGLGTHGCAASETAAACHGRYFSDVQVSGGRIDVGGHFEVRSGSATIDDIAEDRVRGTLALRLEPAGGSAEDPIVVEAGTIDVRYIDQTLDDGRLWCLVGLTGDGGDCP